MKHNSSTVLILYFYTRTNSCILNDTPKVCVQLLSFFIPFPFLKLPGPPGPPERKMNPENRLVNGHRFST